MFKFKNKAKNTKDELEFDTARHYAPTYPTPDQRSRKKVIYECPKCFNGAIYRDEEAVYHCCRCGAQYAFRLPSERIVPMLPMLPDFDGMEEVGREALDEVARRKVRELANPLKGIFDTINERGITSRYVPEKPDTDTEYFDFDIRRVPIVKAPSSMRVPHECPLCRGKDITKDERHVFTCTCGISFYYTDTHADFYVACSIDRVRSLVSFYRNLITDGEGGTGELDALRALLGE